MVSRPAATHARDADLPVVDETTDRQNQGCRYLCGYPDTLADYRAVVAEPDSVTEEGVTAVVSNQGAALDLSADSGLSPPVGGGIYAGMEIAGSGTA